MSFSIVYLANTIEVNDFATYEQLFVDFGI